VSARSLAALLAVAAGHRGLRQLRRGQDQERPEGLQRRAGRRERQEGLRLFTADGQKKLAASLKEIAPNSKSSDCEQLVRDISTTINADNGKRIKAIKITKVKVNGDKASAVSGVETQLAKQSGDWKITDFAARRARPRATPRRPPRRAARRSRRRRPSPTASSRRPRRASAPPRRTR